MNDFVWNIRMAEREFFDPTSRIRVKHKMHGTYEYAECEVVENYSHHVVLREIIKFSDGSESRSKFTFSARKADLFFGKEIEW